MRPSNIAKSVSPGAGSVTNFCSRSLNFTGTVFLFIGLFLCISTTALALPTDKQQMIHVDADTADLDQKAHKGVYTGHVVFNQGSTHVHAAKAITHGNEKNELILAIAEGDSHKQAHFETKTEENKPPMHAFADSILYKPKEHLIELKGHAKITQGTNTFSAPLILYDMEKQQVISRSDGKNRTEIVFYPDKKS